MRFYLTLSAYLHVYGNYFKMMIHTGINLYLRDLDTLSTVFELITAQTPISTQSSNSVIFRLQPVYIVVYFLIKAYVVGTHLNCIDLSMQFI